MSPIVKKRTIGITLAGFLALAIASSFYFMPELIVAFTDGFSGEQRALEILQSEGVEFNEVNGQHVVIILDDCRHEWVIYALDRLDYPVHHVYFDVDPPMGMSVSEPLHEDVIRVWSMYKKAYPHAHFTKHPAAF